MKKLIMGFFVGIFLISCGEQATGEGNIDGVANGTHRIFITSGTLAGDFASADIDTDYAFTVADAHCATYAKLGGLNREYKAIISTSSKTAAQVISITGAVYTIGSSGEAELVAGSTDFWDTATQNHLAQIQYEEDGTSRNTAVWTGTGNTGGLGVSNCNDWKDSSSSGSVGDNSRVTTDWIDNTFEDCTESYPIYCISQ